jgi:hypothetical protein
VFTHLHDHYDHDHIDGGETTSLNCGHQLAYCSSPGWYMDIEKYGGMMSTEENSRSVPQNSLAVLPAELSGSKQEERGREWWIWPCEVFLFILTSDFLHAVKSYDMEPTALLLLRRKVCCGFLSIALAGFEPANRWSDGKHGNHYTTEATFTQLKAHVGNRKKCFIDYFTRNFFPNRIPVCVSDRLWNTLYLLKMNGPTHSADNTHSHALGA